jgi:3-oxoacyl-[acyl-carrier-protein] synthase-3
MRTVVKGTGMYVPPNVVDNDRLSRIMDTSDDWIRQRTGIVTRHFADENQATSDLAVRAAEAALSDAGMDKDEIDYVVFATMTPDYYFPGSGTIFQRKIGMGKVPCLDIRLQCSGFLYGMQLADAMIRSGQYRNVMLIGAEVHGGFMPWRAWDILIGGSDRKLPPDEFEWISRYRDRTVLFGDGAGAFVLSGEENGSGGIEAIMIRADGEHVDKMWVPAGGSAFRPYFEPRMFENGDVVPIVQGREVFKLAVSLMPEIVTEILTSNGYTLDDLSLLVMHQANLRINEAVQKRLELPDEKVYNNIQKYGNTTAATLPIAFHEARTERNLQPGDLVCFVALGSGVNWGAVLYRCA